MFVDNAVASLPDPDAQTPEPTAGAEGADETADASETAGETASPTEPGEDTEGTEESGEQEEDYTSQLGEKTVDELVERFAKRTGLDPNDPRDAKTLKTFADQLRYIEKLKAQTEGQPQDKTRTEFEQLLYEDEGETEPAERPGETGAETGPAPDGTAAAGKGYGDIGDQWKTPEDSLTALGSAYEAGDLHRVHQIEVARLVRNFDSYIAPVLDNHIEAKIGEIMQQRLGGVIPEVQASLRAQRQVGNRNFAIGQLSKVPEFQHLPKFLEPEPGDPVEIDGEKLPNSPLNRVLAEYPEILRIRVDAKDPEAVRLAKKANLTPEDAAERLTFIEQYRSALKLSRSKQLDGGKAKKLLDAGAKLAEREQRDKTRQTLNRGSGPTTVSGRHSESAQVEHLDQL